MDAVLKPFVDNMKKLVCYVCYVMLCYVMLCYVCMYVYLFCLNLLHNYTYFKDHGVEMNISGKQKLIYGALAVISADNLADIRLQTKFHYCRVSVKGVQFATNIFLYNEIVAVEVITNLTIFNRNLIISQHYSEFDYI